MRICINVIQKNLADGYKFRIQYELQQTIGQSSHQSGAKAVPISDKRNEQHGKQGNGTAGGKA